MINFETISLEDLAGYLSEEFRKRGVELVLVGGACATIYSSNRYQSYDLDFITYEDMKKIKKIFHELGFTQKNRYFRKKECKWFVEFVSPPIAIGNEPVIRFSAKKVPLGTIKMLRAEDSVKDRLASYFHWDDRQGLEQAIQICLENAIDLKEVEDWSVSENSKIKFEVFIEKLKQHS